MTGLSAPFYSRARQTLLKCKELETDSSLRSVFATAELMAFKLGIKETNDRESRVDLFLDYILGLNHSCYGPVFPIFLDVLRQRYPIENTLRGELDKLYNAVLVELNGDIPTNTGSTEENSNTNYRLGNAPPMPPMIIGRDEDLRLLKQGLGIGSATQPEGCLQILTAIKGWPGVGKTTIASVLAHDPDIQKTFPDGVLWVSLGQEPDLLSEIAAWGRALGSDELLRARTIEEAQAQMAALLLDRRMLLIVDDVWHHEHAMPFKVGGRGCATLITTRLDSVANFLAPTAGNIYRLKVLKDEDSLTLLNQLAPVAVAQHPDECLILAQELEGLPLALQVAGHLLHAEANYGFGVSELIEELRQGAKLLEAKAPAERADLVNETTPTIAALLQKSLDRLDDFTRDCYAYLGVFAPKPATFDIDAMKFVWQVEDPKPIVRTLVDRGLLEFVFETKRYQMHALMVMLAKSLLTDD
jgi:hypothetical protein